MLGVRKWYFPTPVNDWLRGDEVFGTYQADILKNRYIMSESAVKDLVHLMDEHNHGMKDHTDLLWPLFYFYQFMKVYKLDS